MVLVDDPRPSRVPNLHGATLQNRCETAGLVIPTMCGPIDDFGVHPLLVVCRWSSTMLGAVTQLDIDVVISHSQPQPTSKAPNKPQPRNQAATQQRNIQAANQPGIPDGASGSPWLLLGALGLHHLKAAQCVRPPSAAIKWWGPGGGGPNMVLL